MPAADVAGDLPGEAQPAGQEGRRAGDEAGRGRRGGGGLSAAALAASGALFLDARGRVLLVEPTYKDHWEIPGGAVEPGETPREACAREVLEELGLAVEPGPLLVADWAPAGGQDRVLFVFDGGSLAEDAAIRLPADELRAHRYVEPADVPDLVIPRLARRVAAALRARERGVTLYLEHGVEPA
ncbi:NUDIX domain-containing protein [Actinosynnema sp. NPDC053489]|uniref:NUDIX domain-containing protein n=1 Tax=Actinosynnema sp. NPDC053489 TaxID=3363916 RepID=UPI0037C7D357